MKRSVDTKFFIRNRYNPKIKADYNNNEKVNTIVYVRTYLHRHPQSALLFTFSSLGKSTVFLSGYSSTTPPTPPSLFHLFPSFSFPLYWNGMCLWSREKLGTGGLPHIRSTLDIKKQLSNLLLILLLILLLSLKDDKVTYIFFCLSFYLPLFSGNAILQAFVNVNKVSFAFSRWQKDNKWSLIL